MLLLLHMAQDMDVLRWPETIKPGLLLPFRPFALKVVTSVHFSVPQQQPQS